MLDVGKDGKRMFGTTWLIKEKRKNFLKEKLHFQNDTELVNLLSLFQNLSFVYTKTVDL